MKFLSAQNYKLQTKLNHLNLANANQSPKQIIFQELLILLEILTKIETLHINLPPELT